MHILAQIDKLARGSDLGRAWYLRVRCTISAYLEGIGANLARAGLIIREGGQNAQTCVTTSRIYVIAISESRRSLRYDDLAAHSDVSEFGRSDDFLRVGAVRPGDGS